MNNLVCERKKYVVKELNKAKKSIYTIADFKSKRIGILKKNISSTIKFTKLWFYHENKKTFIVHFLESYHNLHYFSD